MAIIVNNAFTTFDTFVQFAEHRSAAGLKGAAAKATMGLDNRRISVVTVGAASSTNTNWFSRTDADKIDNDTPRDIFKSAGGRMLLQRDMELFDKTLVSGNLPMQFDLMVSPDGNTATINIGCQDKIFTGDRDEATSGTLKLRQKITLDLQPDIPVVTDVKLSQIINP